jgi:hypothetical protein
MLQHHNLYHRKVATNVGYMSNEPIIERTYDTAPTIIRHEEKAVFESHTTPTTVERNVMPTKVEMHMN